MNDTAGSAAAATAAHIDSLGPDALARAASYTAGNHWMMLWGFLVTVFTMWVLVRWGVLDRLQARLAVRGPNLRAFAVAAVFFLLLALLTAPWALYSDWWREKQYGRTSQPLADFLSQALLATLISSLLAGLFFMGVYALMRRTGRRWWLWSGGLVAVGSAVLLLAAPPLIEPLFNKYEPVPPGEVREAVVAMAREAGVPEDRLFVYDGSRQSNNFTANVSGVGSSARVAISDVAYKGASLDEVKAVTGHEIGHYVLKHVWQTVLLLSVLAIVLFFLAERLFPRVARWLGSDARIQEPRGLPVLYVVIALLALLAGPVLKYASRHNETEADLYSLRTVNLPDGLASALVKTAEYRNPRPGALQEFLFYTHPSVERRVRRAMEWKYADQGAPLPAPSGDRAYKQP
jgi:STE24 endopeptidase